MGPSTSPGSPTTRVSCCSPSPDVGPARRPSPGSRSSAHPCGRSPGNSKPGSSTTSASRRCRSPSSWTDGAAPSPCSPASPGGGGSVGRGGGRRGSLARTTGRSSVTAVKVSCVRCSAPASSVLVYAYAAREAWLVDLVADPPGTGYPLCEGHARRIVPPVGWVLHDRRRPEPPLFRDVA
ncbi:MAG TPA: DUF3499 family protein [Actinobacteria bacterium]|nr:DUF3499 family protein [Actinomycetota bacterium]